MQGEWIKKHPILSNEIVPTKVLLLVQNSFCYCRFDYTSFCWMHQIACCWVCILSIVLRNGDLKAFPKQTWLRVVRFQVLALREMKGLVLLKFLSWANRRKQGFHRNIDNQSFTHRPCVKKHLLEAAGFISKATKFPFWRRTWDVDDSRDGQCYDFMTVSRTWALWLRCGSTKFPQLSYLQHRIGTTAWMWHFCILIILNSTAAARGNPQDHFRITIF